MTYATYNITDDKLRLSLGYKPEAEEVEKLKKAGFAYWFGSKLNVAKWSTAAEDYILSLGIEISEDDTPDDVETRVERFSTYADNASKSAEAASAHAHNILAPIPSGQPIQLGHHSERRHRNTIKRADAAMQRAVSETEREAHWRSRVASAIAHAKYKERPDVIARRIKGLEADERTYKREIEKRGEIRANIFSNMRDDVRKKIGADYGNSPEVTAWIKDNHDTFSVEFEQKFSDAWTRHERWAKRWLAHVQKRLEYERALLEAMGGTAKLKWELQVGGQVQHAGAWYMILRINKKGGEIVSVTTNARFHKIKEVGGITDYREPSPEQVAAAQAATKKPALCNYMGEGFQSMTKEEWDRISGCYKATKEISENGFVTHRVRYHLAGGRGIVYVFISDQKETWPEKVHA